MYRCVYIYICVGVYTYIYMYIYIYIYTVGRTLPRRPVRAQEKQVKHTNTNTRQEQHHKRPHEEQRYKDRMWRGDGAYHLPHARVKEKQVTHTNTRHEQHHNRPPHPKNHPPHLTTIEGGAATVRTTSHTHESKRNRSHTQTHDKNNTIIDHTKNHAPLTF